MAEWEHKIVTARGLNQALVFKDGSKPTTFAKEEAGGWEMIFAIPSSTAGRVSLIFKRPRP